MRQLGRALTMMVTAVVKENIVHADIAAHHAPGECHELVARGEEKRLNRATRWAAVTNGVSVAEIEAAAITYYRAMAKCEGIIEEKLNPLVGAPDRRHSSKVWLSPLPDKYEGGPSVPESWYS